MMTFRYLCVELAISNTNATRFEDFNYMQNNTGLGLCDMNEQKSARNKSKWRRAKRAIERYKITGRLFAEGEMMEALGLWLPSKY